MRRRVERLKAQGVSDADIARIHAPIGLDIGAVSPAEIAVAIMAQITERLREEVEAEPAPDQGRVMKFGAVAPQGRARRDRRAYHPAGQRWCSRRAR